LHLQFKLNKPIEVVFESLSNADNFVKAHPIIYLMKPLPNGAYLVYEKLKIALINVDFTYPCTIESNRNDKTINMKAVVKKMVHIQINFKLSTQNGETIVDEFVSFKSILPATFVMGKIFKTQHQKLFQNIEDSE
jgi:carbon monoxide dehydrogenase subunit G